MNDLEYINMESDIWLHDQKIKKINEEEAKVDCSNNEQSTFSGLLKTIGTMGLGLTSFYVAKGMHKNFKEVSKR